MPKCLRLFIRINNNNFKVIIIIEILVLLIIVKVILLGLDFYLYLTTNNWHI